MSTPTRLLATANQVISSTSIIFLPPGGTARVLPALLDVDSNVQQPSSAFTFVSSNTPFATVDSNGVVTAVAVGNATIGVSYGGLTCDVAVTVTDSPLGAVSVYNNPTFSFVAPRPVG